VEIRYARSGEVSIAYQTVGEGPADLLLVHGWVCTFFPGWESPKIGGFYRRLAEIGRLILFDKRGTGLSDRVSTSELPDLETRMDDVRAVLDAAGSQRTILLGISEGGPMSALFAATYPERTVALVLMGSYARRMWAPDYPIGFTDEHERRIEESIAQGADWALARTTEWLGRVAPSVLSDDDAVSWYASYVARGATPGAERALRRMNDQIDVRDVLPAIRVPTLVLYRAREYLREGTRYLAERIPGAELVELPGEDHLPWEGDRDALLDQVERFITGVRHDAEYDRVLGTVLFTDLVGSTEKASELGDRGWRELLERHYGVIRTQLARFRGREVDTTGDGMFALFDGPARAVRCALAIMRELHRLGLEVRVGVHTGEVELADRRVQGIAVHIGARVAAQAGPGEILVTQTVKDLVVGSGLGFEDRGRSTLKGVPGEWQLLAVRAVEPAAV
jgi:pimeloyl-ACP methyl ester carboxylesterase